MPTTMLHYCCFFCLADTGGSLEDCITHERHCKNNPDGLYCENCNASSHFQGQFLCRHTSIGGNPEVFERARMSNSNKCERVFKADCAGFEKSSRKE